MIKCKYCGAEIFDNSKFCLKCGKGIGGETNPSVKAETKKRFMEEVEPICKKYGHFIDREKNDESYREYAESKDKLKSMRQPVDLARSATIAVTCITVAIFSILIPGLNIENENFHWIVKNPTLSLYFCSALGFLPTYSVYKYTCTKCREEYAEFYFGHILATVIIGAAASVPMVFILFFLKGFFNGGLRAVCIVIAVILGLVAVFHIIFYVADSNYREFVYGREKRMVDELEAEYERKRKGEINKVKKKYSDILSEKEMDDCVESVKLRSATKFLEDINKNIRQLGGRN